MGRARFTSRVNKWLEEHEAELDLVVLDMATDIHREASLLAPKASRNLVNSGKITRNGAANYTVSFGNSEVPYAKRRHFENYKNPQTLRYLERPGDEVARGDIQKYFRKFA